MPDNKRGGRGGNQSGGRGGNQSGGRGGNQSGRGGNQSGARGGDSNRGGNRGRGGQGQGGRGGQNKNNVTFEVSGNDAGKNQRGGHNENRGGRGGKANNNNNKPTEKQQDEVIEVVTDGAKKGFQFDKSAGTFEEVSFLSTLPASVQFRVKALKKLQKKVEEIETQFKKELKELELKYQKQFNPVYEKRADIVVGKYEPSEEDVEEEEGKSAKKPEDDGKNGIPEFWLQVLKNHEHISQLIQDHDEEALKYLRDITYEDIPDEKLSISFHFGENPFFTNSVLTKTFNMKEENKEITFDVEATKVDWKPNKNLTVKIEKKKTKKKGKKPAKIQEKQVECESFFNYFKDVDSQIAGVQSMAGLTEYLNEQDYEVACLIRESIIPEAVLWYTGEASYEGDESDEDLDDDDDDDLFDDDDEDDVDDFDGDIAPQINFGGQPASVERPPECKQQ